MCLSLFFSRVLGNAVLEFVSAWTERFVYAFVGLERFLSFCGLWSAPASFMYNVFLTVVLAQASRKRVLTLAAASV